MIPKSPIYYYDLKGFAALANEQGIEVTMRVLAVYKGRGQLPVPAVMVGSKAGWRKDQIEDWIGRRLHRWK